MSLHDLDNTKRAVIKDYIDNQEKKVVLNFDYINNRIEYSKEYIKRDIQVMKDEEIVRAYLLTKLVNELDYDASKIELEVVYKAGRPHTQTNRIDVIVRDNNGDAFLFIELKQPSEYYTANRDTIIEEQLFKVAVGEEAERHKVKYLMLYTLNVVGNTINDDCIIIDYTKFHTYKDWEEIRDYVNVIPARYGKALKTPYVKGSNVDLESTFSEELLEALQTDLHNVLWGGGGTDDNDIFSSLTNLILAKIHDERETRTGEPYKFQSFTFSDQSEDYESLDDLFTRINELYRRALEKRLNITDKNELKKSYVVDTKKFSLEKVKYTVQALERYSFVKGKNTITGKDILGDFFEGIIRDGFKQSKGQFFTHTNIVHFMLWAVQADRMAINKINKDLEIPYMIDPSAGSGTFLIEYMKFITKNIKYRFRDQIDEEVDYVSDKMSEWFIPDERENKWARDYIYGSELNFNLGTATKVNMILHGDGSANVFVGAQKGDGLMPFSLYTKNGGINELNKEFDDDLYGKKTNGQFDLILTNPPFSVDLDNETKKRLKNSFVFGEKKNSENLFIERYYQLLKEGGRMAAVLPDSVFDTTENKYIRLFIYKFFTVKAVVSLPQSTFAPFTNTKTSILFAKKKKAGEVEQWNDVWQAYSKEWERLKTRAENLVEVYYGKKKRSKLPSIKDLTEQEERVILDRFLKDYLQEKDESLSNSELIRKYHDEILDLCKFDKDTQDEFGFVNTWWVFSEVSKQFNYPIFYAEADFVGYKRTKRGLKPQPNDLFRTDGEKNIIVDDDRKETILDYMREIEW